MRKVLPFAAAAALLLALADPTAARAAPRPRAGPPEVVLEASEAPLESVLSHLARVEGGEARVAEDIRDRVSGDLVGAAPDLIALLVEAHGLELYRDGALLWFDREGRTVVDFVPLARPDIARALSILAAPLAPGGTVQVEASERGLVLSGTRAYVRTSLARITHGTGLPLDADPSPGSGSAAVTGLEMDPAADPVADPVTGTANEPSPVPPSLPSTPATPPPSAPASPPPSDVSSGSSPEPAAGAPVPTSEELVARSVLVSSAEPRYVELDDGRRIAIDTGLADGYRVADIERSRLVLERDGALTTRALP